MYLVELESSAGNPAKPGGGDVIVDEGKLAALNKNSFWFLYNYREITLPLAMHSFNFAVTFKMRKYTIFLP